VIAVSELSFVDHTFDADKPEVADIYCWSQYASTVHPSYPSTKSLPKQNSDAQILGRGHGISMGVVGSSSNSKTSLSFSPP